MTEQTTRIDWCNTVDADLAARSELVGEWAFPERRGGHSFTWRLYLEGDETPHLASDTAEQGAYSFFRTGGTVAAAIKICERSAKRMNAHRIK